MNIKKELLEIPDALQQMYEEGRPLYDALIRHVNWGERPVFIVGKGTAYPAALSGAWAFESLLGMPVVTRRPEAFSAYTSRTLAVRSLVIVVSGPEDCEETLLAAKKAKSRGALLWVITTNPSGELAGLADAVINDYGGDSGSEGPRSIFCRHAVMHFLALAAARVLKPPSRALSAQEEELEKLPRHIEWALNQIYDAAGALAKEAAPLPGLYVSGGGPFYPIALQAANRLQLAGIPASGFQLLDAPQSLHRISKPGAGILYLSSSRCGLKAQVHQSVREARQEGNRKIFAITDGNDHQLSERADLAVLLPILAEADGALVALAFLELVAFFAAQASAPSAARRRQPARHENP